MYITLHLRLVQKILGHSGFVASGKNVFTNNQNISKHMFESIIAADGQANRRTANALTELLTSVCFTSSAR
ncbi:MAG: hypothetical protein ACJBCI_07145 [Candidatus Tisiphia sp.]